MIGRGLVALRAGEREADKDTKGLEDKVYGKSAVEEAPAAFVNRLHSKYLGPGHSDGQSTLVPAE